METPGMEERQPDWEMYCEWHYGYGNEAAPFWFVGMEEGGGDTREEVERRVRVWQEYFTPTPLDLAEYHIKLGMPQFFRDPVKLQPTWGKLIRLLLAVKGEPVNTAVVKAYQRDRLGRAQDETCLMELLPLPSPSTGKWNYPAWDPAFPYTRKSYRESFIPWRAPILGGMIYRQRPRLVVFYGSSYREYYELVSELPFQMEDGAGWAQAPGTLFVLVKHPAAWGGGASAAYFEGVGRKIREEMNGQDV